MSTKPTTTYTPIPLDLDNLDDLDDEIDDDDNDIVPRVRKRVTAERWAGKNLATVMFSIVVVVSVFLVGLLVGQRFPSASAAGGGGGAKSQVGGDTSQGKGGLKSFFPEGEVSIPF
jgi:hypothetical protein